MVLWQVTLRDAAQLACALRAFDKKLDRPILDVGDTHTAVETLRDLRHHEVAFEMAIQVSGFSKHVVVAFSTLGDVPTETRSLFDLIFIGRRVSLVPLFFMVVGMPMSKWNAGYCDIARC